jgi:two-component system cell cycle sensor histidine kinase/response regulator CckA
VDEPRRPGDHVRVGHPEIIGPIADDLPVGIWVAKAPGGEFVYANHTFREIMGTGGRADVARGEYAEPYRIHLPDGAPYPEDRMPFVRALLARETVTCDDIVIHRSDGRRVNVRAFARPIFDAAGEITHVAIAFIDITREVQAERARHEGETRLRHAQRMESIGNLAGGIAHDFNNLLASIKILASYLKHRETDPQKLQSLDQIDQVTESGAQLTHALLHFARPQRASSRLVSVHELMRSITELSQRTFDRAISVRCEAGAELGEVVGDPSQLEQVLMNLVINARDAMPSGGELVLRSYDYEMQANGDDPSALPPGRYVGLEVRDTGGGIEAAHRDRVFEPYYTTKTSGAVKGTGLGLATVYGIVHSHGGTVEVSETSPRGTTMRVLLPSARPSERKLPTASLSKSVHLGAGTLLLVDDEPMVLAATAQALREIGYTVMVASEGDVALELFREHRAVIRAVILDLVMPRRSGRETLRALREIDPKIPVLMTTGLATGNADMSGEVEGCVLLPKPFDLAALSEAVAHAVARSRPPA